MTHALSSQIYGYIFSNDYLRKLIHILETCEIGTRVEEEASTRVHLLKNIDILCHIGFVGKDISNISLLIASNSE